MDTAFPIPRCCRTRWRASISRSSRRSSNGGASVMAVSPQLVPRATNILKQPAQEWPVIAAEPSDVAGLLTGYAAPLAAIPAVCSWIGWTLIGIGFYRRGLITGLAAAIVSFVFALAGAYIAAIVIEKLAP